MANILLNKLSLAQIKNQLSKMQSESEAAQKRLESAINGLDFEVASKENIRTKLNKLNTQLYKQISLSEQYGNVFMTVTNSFADVDKSFGNQSQSIMDRIKNFLEDASSTISDLLTRNKILKYSAIAGLFLPGTSILSIIILKDVLENFVVWVKNIFAGNGSEKTDTNSDNDKGTNKEKDSNESVPDKEKSEDNVESENYKQQEETSSLPFNPNEYQPSDNLLKFVGAYEGFSNTVYICPAGKPTIGYGHVLKSGEEFPNGITESQALELMRQDMQRFHNSLKTFVNNNNISLTQCQYDALLSFSYNCGPGWMTNGSGLSKLLINGEFEKIGDKFGEYVKGGGEVLPGLVNRRADESELFYNGDYIRNH